MPPEIVVWTTPLQSVSVTDAGLAAIGGVGELHAPAPAPEAFTVMLTEDELSVTTTVPPPKAADGLVLRMVTNDPLTLAEMLPLLAAAL